MFEMFLKPVKKIEFIKTRVKVGRLKILSKEKIYKMFKKEGAINRWFGLFGSKLILGNIEKSDKAAGKIAKEFAARFKKIKIDAVLGKDGSLLLKKTAQLLNIKMIHADLSDTDLPTRLKAGYFIKDVKKVLIVSIDDVEYQKLRNFFKGHSWQLAGAGIFVNTNPQTFNKDNVEILTEFSFTQSRFSTKTIQTFSTKEAAE